MAHLIPEHEYVFSFARSSGPGGQNVNKTNSKAILHWDLYHSHSLSAEAKERFRQSFSTRINSEGWVVVSSDQFRDQHQNAENCLVKLDEMIQKILYPPKKRVKTKPTRSSVKQRLDSKKKNSQKKSNRKIRYE